MVVSLGSLENQQLVSGELEPDSQVKLIPYFGSCQLNMTRMSKIKLKCDIPHR